MRKRILIVEDDVNLSAIVRENLVFEGFEVDVVRDGGAALAKVHDFRPDLVVLDVMLPGMNGFDICTAVAAARDHPNLMVSARGQKPDRIRGLNLGADDYITKPFELDELLARINAILRRSRPTTDILVLGDIRVDFVSCVARRGKAPIHLTHREFSLLKYLSERPGQVVSP
jgi:DNA-binding response OmpR family regulator